MKFSCHVPLFSILGSAATAHLTSQQPLSAKLRFDGSIFNETIEAFRQERSIAGLSVALTFDDRLVYVSTFGRADREADTKVTTLDRFRLASVSKSITGIAIMHLSQTGALDLKDRVFGDGSILGNALSNKSYNSWELEITVQHLLEHSLGFVDEDMCGEGCDPTYLPEYLSLNQWDLISALLDKHSPSHRPGTFASYSNFGYFIAGRVIEAASGVRNYVDYVKDEVLRPIGITNMTLARDERQENEVKYYNFEDPQSPYEFNVHRRDAVGAWIATPIDLVRILTAVDGLPGRPNFLDDGSIETMFTKSYVTNSSFGKGWDVVRSDENGLIDATKNGGYSGTRSYVNINFRNKTTYAIVVNSEMPSNDIYHGARDLKDLMDDLTIHIEEWPEFDLFLD